MINYITEKNGFLLRSSITPAIALTLFNDPVLNLKDLFSFKNISSSDSVPSKPAIGREAKILKSNFFILSN